MDGSTQLPGASRIGFGAYRIEAGNAIHRLALERALDLGCTLIDTASNYTDGRSEQLIGEVLAERDFRDGAIVMTKAGYVSPAMIEELTASGVDVERLPSLSNESRYSIDPRTIAVQLGVSRRRLQMERLDVGLLHNPEHSVGEISVATLPTFLGFLRRALETLEDEVAAGRLQYYGISSSVLPTLDVELVDPILDLVDEVNGSGHFKVAQFPFNLIENGAAKPTARGRLIDRLNRMGVASVGHRPLSSPLQGGLRLASYGAAPADATEVFHECVRLVDEQLCSQELPYRAEDFMVVQFLRDNREGIDQPDLLDVVFGLHVYPFVEQLWPAPGEGLEAFRRLHDALRGALLIRMEARARSIFSDPAQAGVLDPHDARPLQQIACEYAFGAGLDHLLVGMRRPEYAEFIMPLSPPGSALENRPRH